ncbi:MAG TPA: protein kinase, partial [Gemmatimonadaceae bacterium]
FIARQAGLDREVVIKVLAPDLAAGISADRFEREIKLAASLQQANIVPILAAGESQGMPYYTMPFVEGESLRARLAKDGALPVNMALGVVRDVAKALSYAHQRGVVHRDIKPDNVLYSGGTAVVTDFGIAKAISAARTSTEGATLTQLGTSIGTPAYMSPEQAAGDPNVDHRADIYSLGCMAYELLTGQTPFSGRTPARTLAAHMTETPRPVAELRAEVPPALAELVARCLEKEPSRRPQSGAEVVQALEAITSGGMSSAPGLLRTAPVTLGRALAMYATAFVVVAIVARAAVIALGVPDWFFPGAMIVMALGLPVMLATWYVHRTMRRLAVTSGPQGTGAPAPAGTLQTLAVKASPMLTWRRAWMGGVAAMGAFVLLVGAFMTLRAMGIGPAGSLLASGKMGDRERLIVTDFQSSDTSLVTLVTEAVRTTLGQSRVISIMPPAAIGAALQRMQVAPASRIDLKLARDVAQREGVRAIVDGSIQSIPGGYIVSLRLVSTDSASTLAAFQATANSPRELLETIDGLTRKLRGKIGESLRDVRDSPALEHVTTPSIEALRIYAEAAKSIDMGGNPIEGAARLREAIKLDTTFAMAYRKLGVALSNAGLPRGGIDSALERAYRYRDRLTERERLMAVGTYYQLGPGRDRREAIKAYEALLAIDSTESGAANNLASILNGRREFVRAESLYRKSLASGRATSQQYTNLMGALFNSGKVDEAEKVANAYKEKFPNAVQVALIGNNFLYQRGQVDSMEKVLRALSKSDNPIVKVNAIGNLANLSVLHGRYAEALQLGTEAQKIAQSLGAPKRDDFNDTLNVAWVQLAVLDDTTGAVRRVDRLLAKRDLKAMPAAQRPYGSLATFYATAGNTVKAREFLALDDAVIPDTATRRIHEPTRHGILASILTGEKKYPEALREAWASDTTYDGPDGSCSVCVLDDIGWIWSHAGQADSAIAYFEKYLNTPYYGRIGFDAGTRPLITERLGELYESKGDVVNAAKYYRAFIALWDKADPAVQPKVGEARRRLSRLADTERKP